MRKKKKIGCLFAYLRAKVDSIDSNTKFNHLYAYYKILISLFLNIYKKKEYKLNQLNQVQA